MSKLEDGSSQAVGADMWSEWCMRLSPTLLCAAQFRSVKVIDQSSFHTWIFSCCKTLPGLPCLLDFSATLQQFQSRKQTSAATAAAFSLKMYKTVRLEGSTRCDSVGLKMVQRRCSSWQKAHVDCCRRRQSLPQAQSGEVCCNTLRTLCRPCSGPCASSPRLFQSPQ